MQNHSETHAEAEWRRPGESSATNEKQQSKTGATRNRWGVPPPELAPSSSSSSSSSTPLPTATHAAVAGVRRKSRFDEAARDESADDSGEQQTQPANQQLPAVSAAASAASAAKPKRARIEFSAGGSRRPHKSGIVMNLAQKQQESISVVAVNDASVQQAFANDDDEEEDSEEVPELVRIRMRNLGKYTPTSEGPRSYGKTKEGFIDYRRRYNKY